MAPSPNKHFENKQGSQNSNNVHFDANQMHDYEAPLKFPLQTSFLNYHLASVSLIFAVHLHFRYYRPSLQKAEAYGLIVYLVHPHFKKKKNVLAVPSPPSDFGAYFSNVQKSSTSFLPYQCFNSKIWGKVNSQQDCLRESKNRVSFISLHGCSIVTWYM